MKVFDSPAWPIPNGLGIPTQKLRIKRLISDVQGMRCSALACAYVLEFVHPVHQIQVYRWIMSPVSSPEPSSRCAD